MAKEELWVTLDRQSVTVDDMDDMHVRNTLRMLIRQIRKGKLSSLAYHQTRLIKVCNEPTDVEFDLEILFREAMDKYLDDYFK